MADEQKTILIIGGTGAQGLEVVKGLLEPQTRKGVTYPSTYKLKIITRDPTHRRIADLTTKWGDRIEPVKGSFMDLKIVAEALKGCYGAFVNTDGFTVGEAAEMWAGIKIFELAKGAGVRHYIYSTLDYASKRGNWDPAFACEHLNGKARVAQYMNGFSSEKDGMMWSTITSGPYLQMLFGGLYVPRILEDGTRVFGVPHGQAKIPLINLDDFGFFPRYAFDLPDLTSGQDLDIANDILSWPELVEIFKRVTGHKAVYVDMPFNDYADKYIGDGPVATEVPDGTTRRENFEMFFHYFRSGKASKDIEWVRSIHPELKTVEQWMRETHYDGTRAMFLKETEDNRRK